MNIKNLEGTGGLASEKKKSPGCRLETNNLMLGLHPTN